MNQQLTSKEIEDARRISLIFSKLSEENKTMAMVYLSALRDKELADKETRKQKQR